MVLWFCFVDVVADDVWIVFSSLALLRLSIEALGIHQHNALSCWERLPLLGGSFLLSVGAKI